MEEMKGGKKGRRVFVVSLLMFVLLTPGELAIHALFALACRPLWSEMC